MNPESSSESTDNEFSIPILAEQYHRALLDVRAALCFTDDENSSLDIVLTLLAQQNMQRLEHQSAVLAEQRGFEPKYEIDDCYQFETEADVASKHTVET